MEDRPSEEDISALISSLNCCSGSGAPFAQKLLRGRGVYDTRDGGLSLASFRSVSKISMPTTTAGSLRVEKVVTGETRQYFENGMEHTLRSRQEISEMKERLRIIPYMDLQPEAFFATCARTYET